MSLIPNSLTTLPFSAPEKKEGSTRNIRVYFNNSAFAFHLDCLSAELNMGTSTVS